MPNSLATLVARAIATAALCASHLAWGTLLGKLVLWSRAALRPQIVFPFVYAILPRQLNLCNVCHALPPRALLQ